MKRLLFSTLAAAGLLMAGASSTQSEVPTSSINAEQTAQPTDTTSCAPQQGISQVAQPQVAISPRAFGGSMPFHFYGHTGPRRVMYGKSRWVLMS